MNKIKQRKTDIIRYLEPLVPVPLIDIICTYDYTLTGGSYKLEGFRYIKWGTSFTINTEHILIYGVNDTIQMMDMNQGKHIYTIQDCWDNQSCATVLSSGDIVYGTTSGLIKIWVRPNSMHKNKHREASPGEINKSKYSTNVLKAHTKKINKILSFQTLEQLDKIITCSDDLTVKIFDLITGSCEQSIDFTHKVEYLCMLPDLGFACVSDNKIYIYFNKNGSYALDRIIQGILDDVIKCICGQSDANIITGTDRGNIYTWDSKNGCIKSKIPAHTGSIINVCVLPDKRIVSGCDKILKLWDTMRGTCDHTFESHTENIESFFVLSDGRIVSFTGNGEIIIWD